VTVVVVGGGIAGLAAARRLEATLPSAEVLLLEADARVGGKIATEHVGGFALEAAPDSFLTRKQRGVELVRELDLEAELIGRRPEYARTFVLRREELHPLPTGLTGLVPTDLTALDGSRLLSSEGKARLAEEATIEPAPEADDESLAAFVRRRFGDEAYDALVEPLLSGIYGGDGDQLSLRATFPQLRELELAYGSVLLGLADSRPGMSELPPFVSFRSGMHELVSALVASLERTRIETAAPATAIARRGGGYRVSLEDAAVDADAVVLAVPAFVAAGLLGDLDGDLAAQHAAIPYASSVVVTLAYPADAFGSPLDGYGYLVPRAEGSDVIACTWTSRKWARRAPGGDHLVRVFAGRYGGRDLTAEDDEALLALARAELERFDVHGEPVLTRVRRWPLGMPQYLVGHPQRVEEIEDALRAHPGLGLAGAAYRGLGIPDCIRSGECAADSVAASRTVAGAR
jgi:oxygen-dependent protoporphyrinogen oxidase